MTTEPLSRAELHAQFVAMFGVESRSRPRQLPSHSEIAAAERALGAVFPAAHRQFLSTYGNVWTPQVRGGTSDDDYLHSDLSEFLSLAAILEVTRNGCITVLPAFLTGQADDCTGDVFRFALPFAADSLGNFLCFPRRTDPVDDLEVLVFDHDLGGVEKVEPSFDSFLRWYVQNSQPK